MITTREDFEAALERVLGYLASPPAPGAPEDREFSALLADLKAYHGAVTKAEVRDEAVSVAFEDLDRELASFRRRHADRPQAGSFSGFGFGHDLEGGS